MGGEIFLNFEVNGFSEMAESKGKNQLAPISVHSKNRVRFSSVSRIARTVALIILIFCQYFSLEVHTNEICADVRWSAFRSTGSDDGLRFKSANSAVSRRVSSAK